LAPLPSPFLQTAAAAAKLRVKREVEEMQQIVPCLTAESLLLCLQTKQSSGNKDPKDPIRILNSIHHRR